MAIAKWATPSARSSNLAGTTLNGLASGSESAVVTYDHSASREGQGVITIKLGSINTAAAASISVRVTMNDGFDTADRIGGDLYSSLPLTSGTSPKVVMVYMARLYPFSLRLSVINNSGVALATSGNEIYVRPYPEDIT